MVLEMSGDHLPQFQLHYTESEPYNDIPIHGPNPAYTIREQPLGTAKQIRIVLIGAGASGLNMVRTLRLNLTNYELAVYEKNDEVGGTWYENRYPGVRCDVPSHSYQFSWRPNTQWTNFFSPADEIQEYLCKVCNEEGMRDIIKTSHRILSARWDETKGIWRLAVQNLKTGEEFEDHANFLLDASGILNNWAWPDIPNLQDFQGTLVHTANWPKDFDHKGKTVAVIGNGSSGVQLVPEIQPDVTRMYHLVRTPTWVLPPRVSTMTAMGCAKDILAQIDMDEKENFSNNTKTHFQQDPDFYRSFVKGIEREVNGSFPIVLKDGKVQAFARAKVVEYMTAVLGGGETLCKKLIPDYPLGCRRMTPAPRYLQSLTQTNVDVVTEGIKRIVPDGIELVSGELLKVDAIICATGFDVSFCPRFPLKGRSGNLQDIWRKETPKAYMSCAVAGLPNYFTFLGPNGPIGHGSVFTLTEHIAKYITGVIKKCQTEGIKAIAPSQSAVDDYFEHIESFMPRTAWASSCRSWFKRGNETGPVVALHPGSRIHFFHMLERFRGEDWEYVYDNARQNRFQYLGNGFSTKELDPSIDSTWYLDMPGEA
jgi:cation diffusion facilitator CzcD-associated flavoprotein CzcO